MKKLNGIKLSHHKNTENSATVSLPLPEKVRIPMSMTMGAPCQPLVKVGDEVRVGQKIGEAEAAFSAPVHSGVSGKVTAVGDYRTAMGAVCKIVEITTDGLQTVSEEVRPPVVTDKESFIKAVRESGACGLGGAGFPTHIKLNPKTPIDTLIINAAECEPYITSDHREILENSWDVISGILTVKEFLNIHRVIIGIEDNKPDAVELLESKVADIPNIEVVAARTKYPEGAEKMLIKRVTGRMVPSGGLPADAGCVVSNVSSTKAIADAIQKGMPLIERVVTVSGEYIPNPGNYLVKIGTKFSELADHCGGIQGDDVTVKAGGAMMGIVLSDTDVPVIKGTNGLIAIDTDHSTPVDCIKCGRCVDVCPMELEPLYFAKYADTENWIGMKEMNVMDCMECRCCQYICSSKIPLLQKIQAGKAAVRGMK